MATALSQLPPVHHYYGSAGNGTTSVSAGTAAGTGPTISITGNDSAGLVSLTIGTSPTGSGNATLFTVTFAEPWLTTPIVFIFPYDLTTSSYWALGRSGTQPLGWNLIQSNTSTTTFIVSTSSNGASFPTSTALKFAYQVIGY